MKRILLSLAAVIVSASMVFAQDMAKATETAQSANDALTSGNKELALKGFQEALTMASACGEDGAELVGQCKGVIPNIMLSMAKDCLKASDFDKAITKLQEVVAKAGEYDVKAVAEEATKLIPQAYVSKGNNLLKDKNFEGAAEAFAKSLELDSANGNTALRLGQALAGAGKTEEAVAAFEVAAKNGQEDMAKKQISTIYLKAASSALKTKAYPVAVESAVKSVEYSENPQAYLIAGQASQQANKSADAIKYFEKYLALAPTAKNANVISFTVAALYQKAGNKAKAIEYYQKVVNDPTVGAQAKQQLDALK